MYSFVTLLYGCVLAFSVFVQNVAAQVVLTEIMFDAAGSESHDEFIEIANLSLTDSVDLTGWQISDGTGTDKLVARDAALVLAPGQFGIILDPSYFSNSATYDGLIPATSLIITIDNPTFGSAGLSNSTAETVSLLDSLNNVVSSYTYSLGNSAGFSDEKILLDGDNSFENWDDSKFVNGSPGSVNSVSPAEYDLAVMNSGIRFQPERIEDGGNLDIVVNIRNLGLNSVENFSVEFYDDFNRDSIANPEERLGLLEYSGLIISGDSTTVLFPYRGVTAGNHLIIVEIVFDRDEDSSNNVAMAEFNVVFASRAVRINEVMYSPASGQAEWIEIMNVSAVPVRLFGWFLGDSGFESAVRLFSDFDLVPNEFVVLAEDSSVLQLALSEDRLLVLDNWPSLNNGGDQVVLYDPAGKTIDSLNFVPEWGGGRGISLEKISPELPTNDSTSWTSSVAVLGGSPGVRNSIFTEKLQSRTTLVIEPNPFSPNGDGRDDFALISYMLPTVTAQVNLKIYDLRGRLIRYLATNRPSGPENTLVWDGKDNNGQLARMGIYVVFLQALNAVDGVAATHKKTVVLAGNL